MSEKLLVILLWCGTSTAFAQEPGAIRENSIASYPQQTEVIFGEVELNGEIARPEGRLVIVGQRAGFKSLIHLRANFDDELHTSLREVE